MRLLSVAAAVLALAWCSGAGARVAGGREALRGNRMSGGVEPAEPLRDACGLVWKTAAAGPLSRAFFPHLTSLGRDSAQIVRRLEGPFFKMSSQHSARHLVCGWPANESRAAWSTYAQIRSQWGAMNPAAATSQAKRKREDVSMSKTHSVPTSAVPRRYVS